MKQETKISFKQQSLILLYLVHIWSFQARKKVPIFAHSAAACFFEKVARARVAHASNVAWPAHLDLFPADWFPRAELDCLLRMLTDHNGVKFNIAPHVEKRFTVEILIVRCMGAVAFRKQKYLHILGRAEALKMVPMGWSAWGIPPKRGT